MSSRSGLIVACLVLTAGCNAVPLGNSPSSAPAETLTPAPVTGADRTAMRAPPDGRSPPGVYANGTVNLTELRAAHNASIGGTSYTWVYRRHEGENGTADREFTRRVRVDKDGVLVEDGNLDYLRTRSVYLTERGGYVRRVVDNVTDMQSVEPGDDREYAPAGELLGVFLPNRTITTGVVERDGRRFYRLYIPPGSAPRGFDDLARAAVETVLYDYIPPGSAPRGFDPAVTEAVNVSNYRVTVYVTPAGRIQTVSVGYDRRVTDQADTRVSIRFAYSAIGTTAVTRPDWVSRTTPGTDDAGDGRSHGKP